MGSPVANRQRKEVEGLIGFFVNTLALRVKLDNDQTMDLATGAKDVFVMMTLLTREGVSKLVEACTYPLTGIGCVTRVYTDKAVFLTGPDGVEVRETFGCTLEELQDMVPMPLRAASAVGS